MPTFPQAPGPLSPGMLTFGLNGMPASPSALPYTLPPSGMFGARTQPQTRMMPLTQDPGPAQMSPLPQIDAPTPQLHPGFFQQGGLGGKLFTGWASSR